MARQQAAQEEENPEDEDEDYDEDEYEDEDYDEDEDLEGEICEYCDNPAFSNPEPDLFLCEDHDTERNDAYFKHAENAEN